MSKSLEARLNGNRENFIKDVELYGQIEALDLWGKRLAGYHDLIGLQRFLNKVGKGPNFGLCPALGSPHLDNVADDMLDAILRRFSALEIEKQGLLNQIHRLEYELNYYKGQRVSRLEPKVRQMMTICKEY